MNNTYGYFRGTKGKDGDHIDVFLGPDLESPQVYVVDQVNQDGSFDKHKVMWGFSSKEEAQDAYLSNYSPGWKGLGSITGVPHEVFDEWMSVKTKKQKPFAEYKSIQNNLEIKPDKNNSRELSSENNDIRYRQSKNEEAEKVNEKFNQELEKLTEENSNSTTLHLGTPSAPLISAGIPKKPFLLYGNKLIKKAKKHRFNVRDVKKLPISLSNPMAVFEGSHPNSYALLTEMRINGNNVLISIETRKTGEINFNLVSSVFGKEGKGIINRINEVKLRYAKKNQALNYLRTPALIAGATNNQELDSAANIIQNFKNPTLEEGQIISEVENLADELHTL